MPSPRGTRSRRRDHAARCCGMLLAVGLAIGAPAAPAGSTPASDTTAATSTPTGKLAFTSGGEIWAVNADGTTLVTLTGGDPGDPAWSPDGSMIAFSGTGPDLYVMREDGTDVRRLTTGGMTGASPSWSPDGTRIVFATYMNGRSLYIVNADGTGLQEVRSPPPGTVDYYPAWSPDGTKIAFAHFDGTDNEIYVMDADGTNAVALTDNVDFDLEPAWSPDGSRIAFMSDRTGTTQVFLMDADGTDVHQVTTDAAAIASSPAWSPDGTLLALYIYFPSESTAPRILIVDLTGATVVALTPPPESAFSPTWVAGRVVPPPARPEPVPLEPVFTG